MLRGLVEEHHADVARLEVLVPAVHDVHLPP
jgi:hypothetical protein